MSKEDREPAVEASGQRDAPTELAVATVRTVNLETAKTRSEHDLLGDGEVPADALWGIHTKRAVTNFPITGVPVGHFPEFVRALALVKQAAARANRRLGYLEPGKADVPTVGRVDLRVGRVLIECDSVEHHTGVKTYQADRVRDRAAVLRGEATWRLTYRDVFYDWSTAGPDLFGLIGADRHRDRRHKRPA